MRSTGFAGAIDAAAHERDQAPGPSHQPATTLLCRDGGLMTLLLARAGLILRLAAGGLRGAGRTESVADPVTVSEYRAVEEACDAAWNNFLSISAARTDALFAVVAAAIR